MKALLVTLLRRKSISLLLFAVISCDLFEEEPPNQFEFTKKTEFNILPGSSTVIDLKALIKKSFVSASLTIAENPIKGALTKMDASVFKYTPNLDFISGTDLFVLSAVLDDGRTIKSEPITIHMKESESEFPCGLYAVEDNLRIDPTSTAVIRVLQNDRICGVDEQVNVLIHLAPKFGEALVVGDSIVYTPGPSFSKADEFVYSLSTSSDEELSFGLVSLNKPTVEILGIPEEFVRTGLTNIFFVDDTTGFIAGGSTIIKTNDGGRHWIHLTYPTSNTHATSFDDIFFLDKDHGFAAFYACTYGGADEFCVGGWMMTKNGGSSWDRFSLNDPVSSIIFTSPLIGYISTYSAGWWKVDIPLSVLRTVNGGQTWDQVGDLPISASGTVKFKFATDKVGCAYQDHSINSTTDGGKTWQSFSTDSYVTSLAFVSEDVICASFGGALVRSEDGADWTLVANFPYWIPSQGFSPEGDLGVAVGISETNYPVHPDSQKLTISISADKGKTWVDLAQHPVGYPWEISVPSANVAYILCSDKMIKYTP
ncbi:MAG TPA: hypothetical protein VK589_06305 [Chryseolinea sp.]|nr:hypothetical protein [Chryseolinea sp.]